MRSWLRKIGASIVIILHTKLCNNQPWNRSTNLFDVWMNTNTRQFDVSMHAETSGIYTKQQYVYVNDRQRYATINHIHKNHTIPAGTYTFRKRKERERKRERRRKREKEQTKQTLKPSNHGIIYQTTIYDLFWFLYMSWQRETMYEYQTLLWQLIWQYNTMTPNNILTIFLTSTLSVTTYIDSRHLVLSTIWYCCIPITLHPLSLCCIPSSHPIIYPHWFCHLYQPPSSISASNSHLSIISCVAIHPPPSHMARVPPLLFLFLCMCCH